MIIRKRRSSGTSFIASEPVSISSGCQRVGMFDVTKPSSGAVCQLDGAVNVCDVMWHRTREAKHARHTLKQHARRMQFPCPPPVSLCCQECVRNSMSLRPVFAVRFITRDPPRNTRKHLCTQSTQHHAPCTVARVSTRLFHFIRNAHQNTRTEAREENHRASVVYQTKACPSTVFFVCLSNHARSHESYSFCDCRVLYTTVCLASVSQLIHKYMHIHMYIMLSTIVSNHTFAIICTRITQFTVIWPTWPSCVGSF